MVICPKCSSKTLYYNQTIGEQANSCVTCGFFHQPNSSFQSMERQITGHNLKTGVGDVKAQMERVNDRRENP